MQDSVWTRTLRITAVASILVLGAIDFPTLGADDPPVGSRLSRLFRMGGTSATKPVASEPSTPDSSSAPMASPITSSSSLPGGSTSPRIVPQPRVSRPVTESDPILSRVAIGRTDDGKQFCMSLTIYADGTVFDSDGVHHIGPDSLRPLVQAIQAIEVARVHGHCGAPATDFIEQVHVVVFERAYGKLRANAFSYSGNPGGCDASVKRLHTAVEAIQNKLSGSPSPSPSPTPVNATPIGTLSPSPIPLTGP